MGFFLGHTQPRDVLIVSIIFRRGVNIMNKFLLFLVCWVIFMAIDMCWIRIIMGSFYRDQMASFFRFNMQSPHLFLGILVWALLSFGLLAFVLPVSTTIYAAMLNGLFFGLVVYGVYDLTNYVVINNWSLVLLVVDLAWGCLINSFMATLVFVLNKLY